MAKQCAICGKPSGLYPLCAACFRLRDAGKVKKCEKCNIWHYTDQSCKCGGGNVVAEEKETFCIICGEPSNGKPQCKKCYSETVGYTEMFDKNNTVRELRDYYYNLKDSIFRMTSLDIAKTNCNKLIAIATINAKVNDDTSLSSRMYGDAEKLIQDKIAKTKVDIPKEAQEETKEKDEKRTKLCTAQDGHTVKSDIEVTIDDILYTSYILHAYEKDIEEITEKRKKCDWYIPICNGKGIYIEYWGMDTDAYNKSRKEKEELYQKYKIPYIGIEKDDPKKDRQTFKSNLIKELTKKAKECYGFMPEWKN